MSDQGAAVERNLEAVRRWLAGTASPEGSRETVRELFEPEADYYPIRKWPEATPRHGHDEIERFFAEFWEGWRTWESKLEEVVPVGEVRVFARNHVSATGYESGLSLEGHVFHVFWLRHGRFLRVEDHLTELGARRALGLDDQP